MYFSDGGDDVIKFDSLQHSEAADLAAVSKEQHFPGKRRQVNGINAGGYEVKYHVRVDLLCEGVQPLAQLLFGLRGKVEAVGNDCQK